MAVGMQLAKAMKRQKKARSVTRAAICRPREVKEKRQVVQLFDLPQSDSKEKALSGGQVGFHS